MVRRLPVVAIYSYYQVGILYPLGNLPTMQYLRSFTGGDTVCLLSQGTPWAFVYDFFFTLYKANIAVPVPMVS